LRNSVLPSNPRALVNDPLLPNRLFDPATWAGHIGITLVEIDHPDGVVLPVRAHYHPRAHDFGIGVNPLTYDDSLWYALPDVLAAALLSDAPVTITRAVRLARTGSRRDCGQWSCAAPVRLTRAKPRTRSWP
jgi:hypothetical protein